VSDFLGVSKVEINERFLDQVAAGRRQSSEAARRSASSGEGRGASEEVAAAARAQAREYVKIYFSLGQDE
jgi:hypothetical protein